MTMCVQSKGISTKKLITMPCPKRNATSTKAWIRITCYLIITAPCCFAWVHSYSSIVYPRRKHSRSGSCYSSLQQEDHPSQPSSSSSPVQLDSNKESLNDILKELNQQFNYEGRLPSDYSPLDPKVSTPIHTTATTIPFRCGFVALVGAPNMGKSSLVNALLEEELCITTHRPQTTRHAILAILNAPPQLKCQLCFLDTPGVIDQPAYKLQQGMMEAVQGAFQDADVLLLVTDIFSTPIPSDALFQRVVYLSKMNRKKVIVAINKVDLLDKAMAKKQRMVQENVEQEDDGGEGVNRGEISSPQQPFSVSDAIMHWRQLLPDAIAIIPMCASKGGKDVGVVALRTLLMAGPNLTEAFQNMGGPLPGMFLPPTMSMITEEYAKQIIPVSPPLYSQDTLTDRNSRFFASEIIRASLFNKLGKELPYCCEVRIDEFLEPTTSSSSSTTTSNSKRIIRIKASIHVERDSQKSIVIGKGGEKVKEVGMDARVKLEEFLQEKVHLELFVKVDKDWRKNEAKLKAFGYLH